MIRGTNAEFRFKLPYDFSELSVIKVTFWQDNNNGPSADRPLPIIKTGAQCTPGAQPNVCTVTLHQEETLRFTEKRKAKVQLRAITASGVPIASVQELITVYPICDDSILGDVILPTPDNNGLIILDGKKIIEGE